MASAKQYTPKRRMMMQAVMWALLLLTVALAAAVSSHRRGVFQTKLDSPVQQDGFSIQLPSGWGFTRQARDDSALLFSATDHKEEFRILNIWRNWSDDGDTPVDLVYRQLRRNTATQSGETQSLAVNGQPAAIARGEFSSDELSGMQLSYFVGAIVPPSGHAVIVEYHCINGNSSDEDLMQRVLKSAKFQNEPTIESDGGMLQLPSMAEIRLPKDFGAVSTTDRSQTFREARSSNPSAVMKRLHVYPIVMLPRDTGTTLRTMLSLTQSGFADARVTEVKAGEYRIDPDANSADRGVRPIRSYALTDTSGRGFLAVFKGGDDEQWIDAAWAFLRDNAKITSDINPAALERQGAAAMKSVAATGLTKLFLEEPQDRWLLLSLGARTIGWSHLQQKTGALGGTVETRLLIPPSGIARETTSYQGGADLRSYRSTSDTSFASSQGDEPTKFKMIIKNTSQLRDGRLTLTSTSSDAPAASVEIKVPENFLPGGWLVDLLAGLPDAPMLLRCDTAFGYEYATADDLLTLLISGDAGFKPKSDPDGEAEKCKIVEVHGSGERWRWYFAADGKLISIEGPDQQRFAPGDEADVKLNFSRSGALRP